MHDLTLIKLTVGYFVVTGGIYY